MSERPKLAEARRRVLELGFPPTTLAIEAGLAIGHRLAKPVILRGSSPSRPFAVADGLAVKAADVLLKVAESASREPEDMHGYIDEDTAVGPATAGLEQIATYRGADLTRHMASAEQSEEPVADAPEALQTVPLQLRPAPETNRREDALKDGEAIAVPVGGEVPRGAEVIYPFSLFVDEPQETQVEQPTVPVEPQADEKPVENNGQNGTDEEEDLPVAEPPREWDLLERHMSGRLKLPRVPFDEDEYMVPIGGWAKGREPLIPEKTILRAGDLALLAAAGVDEVEIYRRPVVGVASLSVPFPRAQNHGNGEDEEGSSISPLLVLAQQLARAARVAALPLGNAPRQFRPLIKSVERWLNQVDMLLLVGGSHHGPESLGLDVIRALGKAQIAGIDIEPGACTSVGVVNSKPVFSLPGSLPDVLVGLVMLARPLLHRYLLPNHFSGSIELELERGSQLGVSRDTVLPVRYGLDQDRGVYSTRFGGRVRDSWMDYIRGQALVCLEGGRQYEDGEVVHAYTY